MRRVDNDPKAFVNALSSKELRMFVESFSSYFINNFFGYESLKGHIDHLPMDKLRGLIQLKDVSSDYDVKSFIVEHYDLYFGDLLTILSGLDGEEQREFIMNISDDELRKLMIDATPETIKGAFYRADVKRETFEFDRLNWVGIR